MDESLHSGGSDFAGPGSNRVRRLSDIANPLSISIRGVSETRLNRGLWACGLALTHLATFMGALELGLYLESRTNKFDTIGEELQRRSNGITDTDILRTLNYLEQRKHEK